LKEKQRLEAKMARDQKEREETEKQVTSRMHWLLKRSKERVYMDPVLASQSIRDSVFVDSYASKYRMNRNDISPLFKEKEDMFDDGDAV